MPPALPSRPSSPTSVAVAVRLAGIGVRFDGAPALDGVDLDVAFGELTVLVGANGAGKSTLLEVAAGTRAPTSGIRESAARTVAFVPQRSTLPDRLPVTVRDVVAIGTWGRLGAWRRTDSAARNAISSALERMGLTPLAPRPYATLSGGQRQRALLAQALARRADLLLLDEPTTGLDHDSGDRIRTVLREEVTAGAAVLCVSHDPAVIAAADRVVTLEAGRIA